MKRLILENPHLVVEERPLQRVVVLRRKATRPETPADLAAAYGEALDLPFEGYEGWGLLIDSRLAPGRNEPAFERAMNELRAQAAARFERIAILVDSAIGMLQSQRLRSELGVVGLSTRDEAEAMAFLSGG